ncbi:hypothetical protein GCM10009104_02810 [Marinobacterium maritimum]|uniref:OsmC family peroxiredoxin n=1 Tax=Marinobacterium maritimum TaxID=500162 RepID=A0ABN1I1U5_9GAMM
MVSLKVIYDGYQHCTAIKGPQDKMVEMDCPYSGKGENFSPENMVGSGLAGCMLISMGMVAIRDKIDIDGTTVDIDVEQSEKRIESISLVVNMPHAFPLPERKKLEGAAGLCPIKSSFHPDISISVEYVYPKLANL